MLFQLEPPMTDTDDIQLAVALEPTGKAKIKVLPQPHDDCNKNNNAGSNSTKLKSET